MLKHQFEQTIWCALLACTVFYGIQSRAQAESNHNPTTSKPIIGVNMDITGDAPKEASISVPYTNAIIKAGGVPVLLPPMSAEDLANVVPLLDGIMMIGGSDYPAKVYGKEPHKSEHVMADDRSDFDMLLVNIAVKDKSLPFLGICAGCQALNIASGGTLEQDIPSNHPDSAIKHSSPNGWKVGFNKHPVSISANSNLEKALGCGSLSVVTSHHQCVEKPGRNLEIVARAPDGVIEAIEAPGRPFMIGVQWHPERDYEGNHNLFTSFIEAASKHKQEHKTPTP